MAFPRKLFLPPANRPHWVDRDGGNLPLLYLNWGRRTFGAHPIPISRHEGWIYYLILAGSPQLRLEDRTVSFGAGSLIIIHPDCASGWADVGRRSSESLAWVWRDAPSFPPIAPESGGLRRWKLSADSCREIGALHAACRREIETPDEWTALALENLRGALDLSLIRATQTQRRDSPFRHRIRFAVRWIERHLHEKEPVGMLCDYLQISVATLSRLFQKHLRQSPQEYFHRLKMEKARALLRRKKLSVKEVSYLLGYRYPNDFSRAYKKHFGEISSRARRPRRVTPSDRSNPARDAAIVPP